MLGTTSSRPSFFCEGQMNWASSGRYPVDKSRQSMRKQIVNTAMSVSILLQEDLRRYERSELMPKPLPSIDIESESTRDNAEISRGKKVY